MMEQAKVGLVVLVATALFLTGVFTIANLHVGGKYTTYKIYFKFAGGLEPGAPVRFGGLKVGRVSAVGVDPRDSTRIEVLLSVKGDTPVRADSQASISQLGLLGENYVEIKPGKAGASLPDGSVIPSAESQDLAELMRKMNALAEDARPLVQDLRKNLNHISEQADTLLTQLQDVTGEENRQHLASVMKQTDEMLTHNRPKIDAIAGNLKDASADLKPLMTDLRATNDKLQAVLKNADAMLGENRENVRASIAELEKTLVTTRALVDELNTRLTYNSDNLDVMLENFRQVSENFRELSDTVRQRPFSLIRIKPLPDRQPPGARLGGAKPSRTQQTETPKGKEAKHAANPGGH